MLGRGLSRTPALVGTIVLTSLHLTDPTLWLVNVRRISATDQLAYDHLVVLSTIQMTVRPKCCPLIGA